MHIKELQLLIGPARFAKAAELASKTAQDTGLSMPPDDPLLWTLPQEIGDLLLSRPLSWANRITTLFKLYKEMPCYGLLNFLSEHYRQFEPLECDLHWQGCLEHLDSGTPRLSRPTEYYIWCNFFETGDLSEEAWDALITPNTPENALKSLLLISGPVPFDLKLSLYQRLLPEGRWHHFIFLSLLHSSSEEHGRLEPDLAKEVASKLKLPSSTPHWKDLQRSLGIQPSLHIL